MSKTRQIFLDHATTTPVRTDVLGVMLPFFGNHFGNPESSYDLGQRSRNALTQARARVANLIGAGSDEIVFTSGGTESDNLAVIGYAQAYRHRGRHIITSSVEHNAVLKACRHLEENGFEVTVLDVDAHGLINPSELKASIRQDTILISIMHSNNEVGSLQPVTEIGSIARSRNIAFHTDAIQSLGRIPINVNDLGVTLLSISSHKLYGPKGVGALFVSSGTSLEPIIHGSLQERGLRPGTLNLPGIVGFGKACELALEELDRHQARVSALRDELQEKILTGITGTRILGHPEQRLPHILTVTFSGLDGASLAAWLDIQGIAVGSGASLYAKQPSHVLGAMGIAPQQAFGAIRLSLGWENTHREIQRTLHILKNLVARLREFSLESEQGHLGIITFSSRDDVVRAVSTLGRNDIPHAVIVCPKELVHVVGTHSAITFHLREKDRIGSLLGTAGIVFTGMHTHKPLCRPRSRKEEEFWKKVEEIKKAGTGEENPQ